jgi:hypothetical protein
MRRDRTSAVIIGAIFLATAAGSATRAAPAQGPCADIAAACRQAGFAPGAVSTGNGLQIDCVAPIMQGRPQRAKASKPLPQVDPQLVTACKTRNPSFGQRAAPPAGAAQPPASSGEPPSDTGQPPPSPPPPATATTPQAGATPAKLHEDLI